MADYFRFAHPDTILRATEKRLRWKSLRWIAGYTNQVVSTSILHGSPPHTRANIFGKAAVASEVANSSESRLLGKTNAAQEIVKARIASQRVEPGIHPGMGQSIRTVAIRCLQPGKGLLFIIER